MAYWRFNEGTGLIADDVSSGSSVATLMNGTQWMSGGPLAPDTVAPAISNVATSNLTASAVTVTFTTNEPTTGGSRTRRRARARALTSLAPRCGTSHSVTLTGLAADTLYRYQAQGQRRRATTPRCRRSCDLPHARAVGRHAAAGGELHESGGWDGDRHGVGAGERIGQRRRGERPVPSRRRGPRRGGYDRAVLGVVGHDARSPTVPIR